MQIERQAQGSVPYTRSFPQVRGGTCEHCGVIDNTQPAEVQYTLCPHFQGLGKLRCSYCPESKNPDEVIKFQKLEVHGHPTNPGMVVVVCDSYECSGKHLARFKQN